MLRYVPSVPTFWEVFIINGCWTLSKGFSEPVEMIIWLLFFNLLMWCITLIDLWILENSCIPEINPTWSWCMILLIYCWIWFANICWAFLHLCLSGILTSNFLFLWYHCLVLVSGWCWPCRMRSTVFLPLQFFGSSLRRSVLSLL